jgi:hypothetical protein
VRKACQPFAGRPQGLVTLSTVSSLLTLAGFVSHRQRSWDSRFEAFPSRKASERFRAEEPTYRWSKFEASPKTADYERATSVSGPCSFRESLTNKPCLADHSLDAPLRFFLPGFLDTGLVQDFARTPLTCLANMKRVHAACTSECPSARG